MKITKIELFAIRLPLKEPFVISYTTYQDMPTIIIRLETDEGLIGYGESTPDEHVTGETWESTFSVLKNTLAPALIGENPFNLEQIHEKMNRTVYGVPTAKAGLDIACYDLIGKKTNQPIYNLLGGRYQQELEIPKVISILQPDEMAEQAKNAIKEGYRQIKLKVGTNKQLDILRIKAVRKAVGPLISIKVDANQGWHTTSETMYVLNKIRDEEIDWIEQPIVANDLEGLLEIKRRTDIPLMIDEGLHGTAEMRQVIQKRLVDKINIKLMKCGGLYPALQLVHQAKLLGITCQIGSMVESAVASSAGLHLSISQKDILSNEMVGPLMFSQDIASLKIQVPFIELSSFPGLGIEVDERILKELTKDYFIIEP